MRDINDLEHFVLQEGEVLILRCKVHYDDESLAGMRDMINKMLPGRPVMILPPEIEVQAGRLEIFGTGQAMPCDAVLEAEEIATIRKEITDAYDDGRNVYVDEGDHAWMVLHKHYNPVVRWDWERCTYSLTKPRTPG